MLLRSGPLLCCSAVLVNFKTVRTAGHQAGSSAAAGHGFGRRG